MSIYTERLGSSFIPVPLSPLNHSSVQPRFEPCPYHPLSLNHAPRCIYPHHLYIKKMYNIFFSLKYVFVLQLVVVVVHVIFFYFDIHNYKFVVHVKSRDVNRARADMHSSFPSLFHNDNTLYVFLIHVHDIKKLHFNMVIIYRSKYIVAFQH